MDFQKMTAIQYTDLETLCLLAIRATTVPQGPQSEEHFEVLRMVQGIAETLAEPERSRFDDVCTAALIKARPSLDPGRF